MVNSSFRSILVIILLISSMFIGLIGFENEIVGNSSADVFYVYPTGNVTGNYSKIQHAIDNATAGDTIYVWSGTYSENVIINKSITLIGNGTEATIIQANLSSSHAVHINVSNVNLRGFTASGASGALKAGVFMTDSMNSKLENINASNNYIGIYLTFSDNNLIANCTTNDNSNGIYLFDGCDNNTLVNISSNSNSMGIGIETNSHNNTLIDSTVTENSNYGITLGNSGKLTLKNNNVGPNSNYGIYVYNCQNCEIFENNVSSNAK